MANPNPEPPPPRSMATARGGMFSPGARGLIDTARDFTHNRSMKPVTTTISLLRNTHLFSNRPQEVAKAEQQRRSVRLIPDQLLHPEEPADYIVRRGKLRISQFLDDGREITRAVLQSGSAFRIRSGGDESIDAAADRYVLADIVLMALGEGELWSLPPGTLVLED